MEKAKPKGYFLFSWDETPGNDSERLIDFLQQFYSIDWLKTAKIEKIDDNKTIRASIETNYLSINLNDEKTKANLKIDDGRTDEFIAETMNDRLFIYLKGKDKCPICGMTSKVDKVLQKFEQLRLVNSNVIEDYRRFTQQEPKEETIPPRDEVVERALNYQFKKLSDSIARMEKVIEKSKIYLFTWDDVPGNEYENFILFIKDKFEIKWIETAKIEKIDGGKTIKISSKNHCLCLKLNDEITLISVEMDAEKFVDDRFIPKKENGKIIVYGFPRAHIPTPVYDKIFFGGTNNSEEIS